MYLSELVIDFLEHIEVERGRSQKTAENYHLYLMRLIEFVGDITAEKITAEVVRKWRLWLNRYVNENGDTLSTTTQSYHLIALRSFLNYCAKRNITTLGAERVELPKAQKPKVTFLNSEEVERLINAVDDTTEQGARDAAILEILFSGGLRVSELVGLNRDHINTQRREFTVRGKGQKDRPIFISPRAAQKAARYLEMRKDSLIPLFIAYSGRHATTLTGNFRRLTPRSIQRIIANYALRAGITKHVSPHTMRHSFATDLLRNGADLRSVQSLLGHSDISTTQVYTHVTDPHLREVHEKYHGQTLENS